MSAAVKNFLKTYGAVGIGVYGGVTAVNIAALYVGLRMGGGALLLSPLEKVLGSESETLQKIKQQLGDANATNSTSTREGDTSNKEINWMREGTYFGIAAGVDSLVLPIKLGICLPLARAILKRRGR